MTLTRRDAAPSSPSKEEPHARQHQPRRPHRQPDPRPRASRDPDGTAVCHLRVASNTRRKDASTGEWGDRPNYFDVVVWGSQGETAARYLIMGRGVAIDGRLEWREYEARDGSKRQAVEIVADAVQFLAGPDRTPSAEDQPTAAANTTSTDDDIPF